MKTHNRYEFVLEKSKESFSGNSQKEIFEKITQNFIEGSITTKARIYFDSNGLTDTTPDENDEGFYDKFFQLLQNHLVGTWKYYDSLANDDYWRYDAQKNDFVRRAGKKGERNLSPEAREKFRENIKKAHEKRRQNHELAREIARNAGIASQKKHRTVLTEERKKKIHDGITKYWQSMTEEEKAIRSQKLSIARKEANQRRKELGIPRKRKAVENRRIELENQINKAKTEKSETFIREVNQKAIVAYNTHVSGHNRRFTKLIEKYSENAGLWIHPERIVSKQQYVWILHVGVLFGKTQWGVEEIKVCEESQLVRDFGGTDETR